jgi:hypothetical protein
LWRAGAGAACQALDSLSDTWTSACGGASVWRQQQCSAERPTCTTMHNNAQQCTTRSVAAGACLNFVGLCGAALCRGLRLRLHAPLAAAVAHGAQVDVERRHALEPAAGAAHVDHDRHCLGKVLAVCSVQRVPRGDLGLEARLAVVQLVFLRPGIQGARSAEF